MAHEVDWQGLPPFPALHEVGKGGTEEIEWTLLAGGTEQLFDSVLQLRSKDGRSLWGGGASGPALIKGRATKLSIHRIDEGVRFIVGRVSKDVFELHLRLAGSREARVIKPFGQWTNPDLKFVVAILPPTPTTIELAVVDVLGHQLERRYLDGPTDTNAVQSASRGIGNDYHHSS